jgi:hypothetical protein
VQSASSKGDFGAPFGNPRVAANGLVQTLPKPAIHFFYAWLFDKSTYICSLTHFFFYTAFFGPTRMAVIAPSSPAASVGKRMSNANEVDLSTLDAPPNSLPNTVRSTAAGVHKMLNFGKLFSSDCFYRSAHIFLVVYLKAGAILFYENSLLDDFQSRKQGIEQSECVRRINACCG